jgi:hypothetical protein
MRTLFAPDTRTEEVRETGQYRRLPREAGRIDDWLISQIALMRTSGQYKIISPK